MSREGARVIRAYQYARWVDASTHLWISRRKQASRGERPSGLRLDGGEVQRGRICPAAAPAQDLNRINALAFSPDGTYLATASDDRTARGGAATDREVARMAYQVVVLDTVFSQLGRYLAIRAGDRNPTRANIRYVAQVWLWRYEDSAAQACERLSCNLTLEERQDQRMGRTLLQDLPEIALTRKYFRDSKQQENQTHNFRDIDVVFPDR